jgi:hypothetical protein
MKTLYLVLFVAIIAFACAIMADRARAATQDTDAPSIPYAEFNPAANAITESLSNTVDQAIKSVVSYHGDWFPGQSYTLSSTAKSEYLGSGPRGIMKDGQRVGSVAFYFRLRARAKFDVDVFLGTRKLAAVETNQVFALLAVPNLSQGKIIVSFEPVFVSETSPSKERYANQGHADSLSKGVRDAVLKKLATFGPKEITLPQLLAQLTNVASLVVNTRGLSATLGSPNSGWAVADFEPKAESPPARPPIAVHLSNPLFPENTIVLYSDDDFKGEEWKFTLDQFGSGVFRVDGNPKDKASSVRWRLPNDEIVRLIDNSDGSGDQISLFGEGQIPSLRQFSINDRISSMRREGVGGSSGASNKVVLYWDDNFGGGQLPIEVSSLTPATLIRIDELPEGKGWNDKPSSVKCDLPPGTIVLLVEDVIGTGNHVVVHGKMELGSLNQVGLGDAITGIIVFP